MDMEQSILHAQWDRIRFGADLDGVGFMGQTGFGSWQLVWGADLPAG